MPVYNIYDSPSATTPITPGAPTPTGISALLADRNFINLLAGIGSSLDPKGVGGALGLPTIAYNQSVAAQNVGAKVANQPTGSIRRYRDVQDRLGGDLTPRGTPGPTRFEAKKDGSYLVEGDLDVTPEQDLENTLAGFDHDAGHPLLLLCNAKAPNYGKNKAFNDLAHYAEWPKVAGAVIKALSQITQGARPLGAPLELLQRKLSWMIP